jgi:DnaJ family protein C protein 7
MKIWKIINSIENEKNAANEQFKAGNFEKALELYTELLNVDPDNRNFNSTIYTNRSLCKQVIKAMRS